MSHLTYLDFMSRNLSGMVIHPETQKAIETVHHHVEHNLPIRREVKYFKFDFIFLNFFGK